MRGAVDGSNKEPTMKGTLFLIAPEWASAANARALAEAPPAAKGSPGWMRGAVDGSNKEPTMNRTLFLIAIAWASAANAQAPSEIPLYPGAAPGSEKWDW